MNRLSHKSALFYFIHYRDAGNHRRPIRVSDEFKRPQHTVDFQNSARSRRARSYRGRLDDLPQTMSWRRENKLQFLQLARTATSSAPTLLVLATPSCNQHE